MLDQTPKLLVPVLIFDTLYMILEGVIVLLLKLLTRAENIYILSVVVVFINIEDINEGWLTKKSHFMEGIWFSFGLWLILSQVENLLVPYLYKTDLLSLKCWANSIWYLWTQWTTKGKALTHLTIVVILAIIDGNIKI